MNKRTWGRNSIMLLLLAFIAALTKLSEFEEVISFHLAHLRVILTVYFCALISCTQQGRSQSIDFHPD